MQNWTHSSLKKESNDQSKTYLKSFNLNKDNFLTIEIKNSRSSNLGNSWTAKLLT